MLPADKAIAGAIGATRRTDAYRRPLDERNLSVSAAPWPADRCAGRPRRSAARAKSTIADLNCWFLCKMILNESATISARADHSRADVSPRLRCRATAAAADTSDTLSKL